MNKVSYGQTEDEYIEIESLSDEIRFKMCMKLYKLHPTVKALEGAIIPEALCWIEETI
jgi:hypothetical protein